MTRLMHVWTLIPPQSWSTPALPVPGQTTTCKHSSRLQRKYSKQNKKDTPFTVSCKRTRHADEDWMDRPLEMCRPFTVAKWKKKSPAEAGLMGQAEEPAGGVQIAAR
jgi:hypothetical protein